MILVTSSGIVTSLSWWTTLACDGNAVTLTRPCDDNECPCPPDQLVVAELRSPAEAGAFHRTLTERIGLKAKTFYASEWPTLKASTSSLPAKTSGS